MITIGLFGTCGQSQWRAPFIKAFEENGIRFYNPQLGEGEWKPEFAEEYVRIENQNLKSNELVLFPVTDETTAFASLGEIGFSVLDTIRSLGDRFLIVYIDDKCRDPKASESEIEASERMRKLVKSKTIGEACVNDRVIVVNDLESMFEVTMSLAPQIGQLIKTKRSIGLIKEKFLAAC